MRVQLIVGSLVSVSLLLGSSAFAAPGLKGQIKGQRENGRLMAINVGNQFTMTRGGTLLLNKGASPGYLRSLGAARITSAVPTADGRFEIAVKTIQGTPLDRMVRFMAKLGRAPRVAKETLPVEGFSIGGPGVGGAGEIGHIKASITVLTGTSVLTYGYAKELVSGRGFNAPSFDNYLREPAGR
jgi:hypothetical protein